MDGGWSDIVQAALALTVLVWWRLVAAAAVVVVVVVVYLRRLGVSISIPSYLRMSALDNVRRGYFFKAI